MSSLVVIISNRSNNLCIYSLVVVISTSSSSNSRSFRSLVINEFASFLTTCRKEAEASFPLPLMGPYDLQGTVGFHNFNLRIFNLRVSNPNKLIVDVFLTRCRTSMCQGLGPKKHDEISEIDRTTLSYRLPGSCRPASRPSTPPGPLRYLYLGGTTCPTLLVYCGHTCFHRHCLSNTAS